MSLWGKTDTLADAPKYVTRIAYFDSTGVDTDEDTINLIQSNTGFATGDAVHYSINGGTVIGGLTDATVYYVRVVGAGVIALYDTYAHAIDVEATTGLLDITGAGVGMQTLQRTTEANAFGDSVYNGTTILFVDREESQTVANQAKGLTSPGWWAYKTYTDAGSATRHKAELLVAIDVVTVVSGDADDDTVVVDLVLTIATQPVNETVNVGDDATFTVATTTNSAQSVTYQWQVSTDAGSTWDDIVGETASTLTLVAVAAADDGNQYRVVLVSGTATETSAAATLTVTV